MSARSTYRHWQDEKPYHLLRLSYGAVAETYNLHFFGTVRLLLIIIRQKFVIPVGHAAVNENYARTEFWAVSIERWYPAVIHVCLDLPCGLSLREQVVSCPTSIAVNLYRRIFFRRSPQPQIQDAILIMKTRLLLLLNVWLSEYHTTTLRLCYCRVSAIHCGSSSNLGTSLVRIQVQIWMSSGLRLSPVRVLQPDTWLVDRGSTADVWGHRPSAQQQTPCLRFAAVSPVGRRYRLIAARPALSSSDVWIWAVPHCELMYEAEQRLVLLSCS